MRTPPDSAIPHKGEEDGLGTRPLEAIEDLAEALLVVGHHEGITARVLGGEDAQVEGPLGDVNADVDFSSGSSAHSLSPSSSRMSGLADTGLPTKRSSA